MIRSMTGYGRRESTTSAGTLVVEARSVNHRFCEIVVRTPKPFAGLEDRLRKLVARRVQRGRVDVSVTVQGQRNGAKSLALDRTLAKQYHRALRDLQRELKLPGTVDVSMVASVRDIVSVTDQPATHDTRLERVVLRLLSGTLSDLDAMRVREGKALARDLTQRIRKIGATADAIERRGPLVLEEHFARMKARVEKLLNGGEADTPRLHQELAVYADRGDITEELTRLRSHLAQLDGTMRRRGSIGKTLDFLLQEVGREVNTIGSKANDAQVATHVVEIKAELEKIREQVQNIE